MLIRLAVTSGAADLYVTTFNRSEDDFVSNLPSKKDDAIWIVQDINSINQLNDDKTVLILQNDRWYCTDCYYIIGVVTHEGPVNYQISV